MLVILGVRGWVVVVAMVMAMAMGGGGNGLVGSGRGDIENKK